MKKSRGNTIPHFSQEKSDDRERKEIMDELCNQSHRIMKAEAPRPECRRTVNPEREYNDK